MTDSQRQKLLNWLTSMLVLMLLTVLGLVHDWFVIIPERLRWSQSVSDHVIVLANGLSVYMLLFIPVFLWHVSDFVQSSTSENQLVRAFASFRLFLASVILTCLASILMVSPWLNDLFCPVVELPPGVFEFDGCGSWTPWWKEVLLLACLLSLCVLVLGKITVAIRSCFKKIA
jgi:uncharacterized membrane protein YfhO